MESKDANELIKTIKKTINSKGADPGTLVPMFQKLRPYALEEEDPLATKVIRMTYEHLENNEGFLIDVLGDNSEDEETEDEEPAPEESEPGEPASAEENLSYLCDLLAKSDNEFNRDELRSFRDKLKSF